MVRQIKCKLVQPAGLGFTSIEVQRYPLAELTKMLPDLDPQQIAHSQGSRREQGDDQSIAVVAGRGGAIPIGPSVRRPIQDLPSALDQFQTKLPKFLLAGTIRRSFPRDGEDFRCKPR